MGKAEFNATKTEDQSIIPPVAEKIPFEIRSNGFKRTDNYYWMRDRDSSKVLSYLSAENFYTDQILKDSEKLRLKVFEEIIGRIKKDDSSVPYMDNGYYYYHRYEEDSEYPVYCRKMGSTDSEEEIILDVNRIARGYDFYHAAGLRVSPSNNILAYGIDTLGRRKFDIRFKDLVTGELFKDVLLNTSGAAAWADDNRTVFYIVRDASLRPYKVFKHRLGTPQEEDVEVFYEDDETFTVNVYRSKSKKIIFIESYSTLSTEYRFLDASDPDGEFKVIQPRRKNLEYSVAHDGDLFFIVTNHKAKNFRLMSASIVNTSIENWSEIIPHREKVLLESAEIFKTILCSRKEKTVFPALG